MHTGFPAHCQVVAISASYRTASEEDGETMLCHPLSSFDGFAHARWRLSSRKRIKLKTIPYLHLTYVPVKPKHKQ